MAINWYAAVVKRQKEREVCDQLRASGFCGYVPRKRKKVLVGRRPKQWEEREVPLLRGVVFVASRSVLAADPYAWRAVVETDHVRYLIGAGQPKVIPRHQIKTMLAERGENEKTLMRGAADVPTFEPDQLVTMKAGAFSGLSATVRELRGRRAMVLAQMLGGERMIEVDARDLVAAE